MSVHKLQSQIKFIAEEALQILKSSRLHIEIESRKQSKSSLTIIRVSKCKDMPSFFKCAFVTHPDTPDELEKLQRFL